ncbi:hypothetical protein C5B42_01690 [Candidatus Cerribacteria bacterium 'Amazon FNV 2010 28 9']|uniref:Uncharacterized protein n=1 Tax=Candidatus Cerribacteria bacterium 'Amazon FNV 2010 28 9' TaxID=2081795 RepID=A0A317JQY8_9BACT|nr:MAG: hypothetical protein C5B42_01690 [Candidatus Cerribacteria bacterium 'Amazon FNV 2010 28 9']
MAKGEAFDEKVARLKDVYEIEIRNLEEKVIAALLGLVPAPEGKTKRRQEQLEHLRKRQIYYRLDRKRS